MPTPEDTAFDELYATQHFSWHELRAPAHAETRAALRALCECVLEPLRLRVGGPILVTSGYRNSRRNAVVHGAERSQHERGEAVDIEHPAHTSRALARELLLAELPFDQLIWYNRDDHVHVSYIAEGGRRANRGEVLHCVGDGDYRRELP